MKRHAAPSTVKPWRRTLALSLALLVAGTPATARGPAHPGVAELEDVEDILPPTNTGLPPGMVFGVEATVSTSGGVSDSGKYEVSQDVIAGAPGTMTLGEVVVSAAGELLVTLEGVESDAMVGGRRGKPAVSIVAGAALIPPLQSLKTVPVPPVPGLDMFIRDRKAAIALGKALFWDSQVGSDGQACASCHFHAGADNRWKNQLNPGPDGRFNPTFTGGGGANYTLKPADFPFHRLVNPMDRNSDLVYDSDDVVSSQGTFSGDPKPGRNKKDKCTDRPLDVFSVGGVLTRRVPGRNSPTVINAAYNFRNFWDGRANNVFNGVNPFGNRDPNATVLQRQADGSVVPVRIALRNASLASQAVGPALSPFEMSCEDKVFHDLGKKMLGRRPLANQEIAPTDSVLAAYRHPSGKGLKTTYTELIKQAFDAQWWKGAGKFDGYTQMEANFSLFWGLAIMAYESTLVSDEAPVDRYVGWPGTPPDLKALGPAEQRGLAVFRGKGLCVSCHKGAEFTSAATAMQPGGDGEPHYVEHMFIGGGQLGVYDNGFYNIGVRPSVEDRGVGGSDPFGNPLSFSRQYLSQVQGKKVPDPVWVDPCLFAVKVDAFACWTDPDPSMTRVGVDGAFKTPGLRNIALTAPYFHNGSRLTLEQVIEFYDRGGDVRGLDGNDTSGYMGPEATNGGTSNVHPNIRPLGLSAQERSDLAAFLRNALTDPRVACERAPFDHPSLVLFNGHTGDQYRVLDKKRDGKAEDETILLPAVGAEGRPAAQCMRNDDGSSPAVVQALAK